MIVYHSPGLHHGITNGGTYEKLFSSDPYLIHHHQMQDIPTGSCITLMLLNGIIT